MENQTNQNKTSPVGTPAVELRGIATGRQVVFLEKESASADTEHNSPSPPRSRTAGYSKPISNNDVVMAAPAAGAAKELKHESTLFAESVVHIGAFPVTNAMLTSTTAVIIIAILALTVRTRLSEIPKGIQNIFESVLDGALSLADQVTNDRKISLKVFPLAFAIFLFILVNNWLGLLPLGGLGVIETGKHGSSFIPFLRSGTADINTTVALAVMSVLGANIFGIFSIGIWKSFNKYVNLKALGGVFTEVRRDPKVLVVAPVTFFVGLLELIGELAKIASLSFRLF